ncbi:MAG: tetratricopeptide repeat protein [Thermoleophilia bacterium]|jgi:hypothetical protein|nr:tetratricopeptide repeat protein [Thermoleophilia bacterium]
MYCPECGNEAGEAKFCPECGADLGVVRGALKGKAGARGPGDKSGGRQGGAAADGTSREGSGGKGRAGSGGSAGRGAAPAPSGGLSPRVLWVIVAVVAVAVVIAVALLSSGGEQPAADPGSGGTTSGEVTPVAADLSGSYRELVQRAHDLYDQGDALIQAGDFEQGVEYFAAAAQVYEAAWAKEPGDPSVGTDWATSLFYSGDFDGAVAQVEIVLEENPDFQPAWFNLGNYLQHQARMAESSGDAAEAERLNEATREAYERAAEIDPASDTGIEAAARAAELAQ